MLFRSGVTPGIIGGTYGGNPLACAAALKVLEIMEKEKLPERALELSSRCFERFESFKEKYDIVGDVRGIGLMLGIEFVKDKVSKEPNPEAVSNIVNEAIKNGLMIESAGIYGNVIRFLSPLVITDEQLEVGFTILEKAIEKVAEMR